MRYCGKGNFLSSLGFEWPWHPDGFSKGGIGFSWVVELQSASACSSADP